MTDEEKNDNLWKSLEAQEYQGRLLYPGKLARKKKDGTFEYIDIMLRVPREPELRKARVDARKSAIASGLDLDRDKDLVEDLENIHILSYCIRSSRPPSTSQGPGFEQWVMSPQELEETYDRQSIMSLWQQLNSISESMSPSEDNISESQFIFMLSAMTKERSIHPLAVYGPDAQRSFILTMADRLMNYMA